MEEAGQVLVRLHQAVDLVVLADAREHVVARLGELLRLGRDGHAARVVLGAGDHRVGRVGAHLECDLGDALHLDGEAAEDGEPEDREEGRADEAADDHLAHRAAARDERDEEADEGRPRDPPRPVEDRPPVHELGEGVVVVRHRGRARVRACVAHAPHRRVLDGGLRAAREAVGVDAEAGGAVPQGGARRLLAADRVGAQRVPGRSRSRDGRVGEVVECVAFQPEPHGMPVAAAAVDVLIDEATVEILSIECGDIWSDLRSCGVLRGGDGAGGREDDRVGGVDDAHRARVGQVAAVGRLRDRRREVVRDQGVDRGGLEVGAPQLVLVCLLARIPLDVELLEGLAVEADLDDPLEVVARRLHDEVQAVPRVVREEDGEEDDHAEREGDLGEDHDALVEAGEHRDGGEARDEGDDRVVGRLGRVLIREEVHRARGTASRWGRCSSPSRSR